MQRAKMRLFLTILFLFSLASSPAAAQDAQDRVPLSVTRAELQIIGQALMEIPYKTAAGPLATLQQQLNTHDTAVRDAQVKAAKAKADADAEAAKAKEPAKDQEKAPETTSTPPAK